MSKKETTKTRQAKRSRVQKPVRGQTAGVIIKFLELNGWEFDNKSNIWLKETNISFSVDDEYLVFIGEAGDFKHHRINESSYCWLIGWMIEHHLLSFGYKSVSSLST